MPDEVQAAQAAYDKMAGTYERNVAARAYYLPRAYRFLRHFARAGKRVLGLGCGTGLAARWLRDEHFVGVDVSPGMLRLARARRPAARFIEHDYHQPFPESLGKFDAVLALSSLEFCHDLPALCRNIAAVLAPGGRVLLTPVHRVANEPRVKAASPRFPGLMLHAYDREEMQAALRGAGLAPVSDKLGKGWNAGHHVYWYRYWTASKAP